jgi:hypothetical protein
MITTINEYRKNEGYGNDHQRVIPRDFFNESKLLKCMGQLAVRILDGRIPEGITIEVEEAGEAFDIQLSNEFGCLFVANYPVTVNGEEYFFGTLYNSKDAYPMICYVEYDEILVFDEQGNFTAEFVTQFTNQTEDVQA